MAIFAKISKNSITLFGTEDSDYRWQGNRLETIGKSEECEVVIQDCASNMVTNCCINSIDGKWFLIGL